MRVASTPDRTTFPRLLTVREAAVILNISPRARSSGGQLQDGSHASYLARERSGIAAMISRR
jgi:hypothetical protein